jgi:FkbM family methyltransferase
MLERPLFQPAPQRAAVRNRLTEIEHLSPRMAYARAALNSWLEKHGYSLKWLPPSVLLPSNRTVEIDFSLLAAHLMLTTPQPYFINIGANDGVTHDPLYPFVRDFGWRGIMVEPIPEAFAALERNYAGFVDVTLVQAAVGLADGEGTIYTIDFASENAMVMSLHSSFNRDVLLRGSQWHPNIARDVVEREIKIMSFSTLLSKAEGQAIDVLKIDAEGYDLEILKSIDLANVRPKLISAEHANISKKDKIKMADILLAHKYRVSMTSLDMLGYQSITEHRRVS